MILLKYPLGLKKGRQVMVKKVFKWGSVAFLIFFVAYRPESAAEVFKSIGGSIMEIGNGFGTFFSSLVS